MKNNKKEIKITKDVNLSELVYKHPETEEVLLDYGLHCVGCIAGSFDTLEAGAKVHGLGDKDIEELVERINEIINYHE